MMWKLLSQPGHPARKPRKNKAPKPSKARLELTRLEDRAFPGELPGPLGVSLLGMSILSFHDALKFSLFGNETDLSAFALSDEVAKATERIDEIPPDLWHGDGFLPPAASGYDAQPQPDRVITSYQVDELADLTRLASRPKAEDELLSDPLGDPFDALLAATPANSSGSFSGNGGTANAAPGNAGSAGPSGTGEADRGNGGFVRPLNRGPEDPGQALLEAMAGQAAEARLSAATGPGATATVTPSRHFLHRNFARTPLSFEPNRGQTNSQAQYLSRGRGYNIYLTSTGATLSLNKPLTVPALGRQQEAIRLQLVGGNPAAKAVGLDGLPGRTNYLVGRNSSQWLTHIPNYEKVAFRGVYSGVDLIYYGNQRQVQFDFVVASGANPNAIRLAYQGPLTPRIDAQGHLRLPLVGGELIQRAPVVYQLTATGQRQTVSGRYVLHPGNQIGFEVGAYDTRRPRRIVARWVLHYNTVRLHSAIGYLTPKDSWKSRAMNCGPLSVMMRGVTPG